MEYQIKDIAKIMGLSKQMIRYYEDCGVITPKRQKGNNYRVYDVKDFFSLSEAVALSRFHINIKDIYRLSADNYIDMLTESYRKFIDETEEELFYKSMLKDRAKELLSRTENAEMNVGHIWVKRIPAMRMYPMADGHNDEYENILVPPDVQEKIYAPEVIAFGEGILRFGEGHEKWWCGFHQRYIKALELPVCEESIDVPENYSVCVTVNMGGMGAFDVEQIKETIDRIRGMDYVFEGEPQGMLLCRGSFENEFRRLLELQIPVRKP